MASDRRVLARLAIAFALASAPAAAQTTPADRETARHLMDEGYGALERGDAKTALDRFIAADALVHAPTTRLAVAKAQLALGRLLEARESALDVARATAEPGEPRPFTEARKEAQAMSDAIAERIPALRVVVRGAAEPAVTVDGVRIPAAALVAPRRLNPGKHHVVAREGEHKAEADVDLAERDSREVTLDLAAPAVAPEPAPAAHAEPEPAASSRATWRTVSWIGFGVAAAGVVTGAATGIVALSAKGSAQDGCVDNKCPPSTWDDLDRAQTFGDASTIAFVGAGVGAAVGVAAWWMARPAASAAIVVGPRSIGVAGRF